MASQNPNQPPQQQGTWQSTRQQLANPTPMRRQEHVAEFSGDPVTLDSRLSATQYTFQDPDTGEVVSITIKGHAFLACGCRICSPNEVGGLCSGCSKLTRRNRWRRPAIVCKRHALCHTCRSRRLRELRGGGPIKRTLRFLLKVILWPLFDVEEPENAAYTQARGPLGEVPRPRPGSSVSPRTRTPRR